MGPKASSMAVCKPTPEMSTKIKQIEEDIESGKIKVSEG
jgi:basic membrane protein A